MKYKNFQLKIQKLPLEINTDACYHKVSFFKFKSVFSWLKGLCHR